MHELTISKLADVLSEPVNARLSLFCTVAECQSLFRCKPDQSYFTNLTLVCTSLEDAAVEATVFFNHLADMPQLRSPGDVVLICNARVNEHEGERNLKIPVNRDSGFALFDPTSDAVIPYAKCGAVCDMKTEFEGILGLAKEYALMWKSEKRNFYISEKEITFDALNLKNPTETWDLACKVVSADLHSDPKLLWVWDGTDVKPENFRGSDTPNIEHFGQSFLENLKTVKQLNEEGEEPLPSIGTILPVAVIGERTWIHVPSSWIKLRNISVVRYKNQVIILYSDATRWSRTAELPSVSDRYRERLETHLIAMHVESGSVMSRVYGHPCAQTPLREVNVFLHEAKLNERNGKREFRCLVYMMQCQTDMAEIARRVREREEGFEVKVTLQDATGSIDALLFEKHAWRFFGLDRMEIDTPDDPGPSVSPIVTQLRRALEANDPVPWLDVCLRVMYREGTEIVQILDTELE